MNEHRVSRAIIIFCIMCLTAACISCLVNNSSTGNIKDIKPAISDEKLGEADYTGVYRFSDSKACSIVITIKKDQSGYIYTIAGTGVKSSGKLKVAVEEAETYLTFSGTLRGGDKTPVEGIYSNRKITIQNYGNSMNQYICFKTCDAKFLEFVIAE